MNYPKSPTYNEKQQAKVLEVINSALTAHKRLMAIRVDCRFPNLLDDGRFNFADQYTDSVISRFIASLKAKLDADLIRKEQAWGRSLKNHLSYVWAREIGPRSQKPHYHLLLLMNKDVYHCLGDYQATEGTLASLISSAWCSALGLPAWQFGNLVSFPQNPVAYLDVNSGDFEQQLFTVLHRAAYLCKFETKQAEQGFRAFGTSRIEHKGYRPAYSS